MFFHIELLCFFPGASQLVNQKKFTASLRKENFFSYQLVLITFMLVRCCFISKIYKVISATSISLYFKMNKQINRAFSASFVLSLFYILSAIANEIFLRDHCIDSAIHDVTFYLITATPQCS